MKAKNLLVSVGLITSYVLFITTSAKAASFTTQVNQKSDPKADIWLQSITQNGKTIKDFSLIKSATIIYNTPYTGGNIGAASTDKGDNASAPLPPNENPTGTDIAAYLGNKNLNNLIDTEDSGAFNINVFFDSLIKSDNSGLDSLFFWERGKNSDLQIQALDASGNTIGNVLKLLRGNQTAAGFQVDTKEIGGPQDVGSWGVNLSNLGVSELKGLKLTANSNFNGPDFKVVARKSVPEPSTIIALGAVAILAFLRLQKNQAISKSSN